MKNFILISALLLVPQLIHSQNQSPIDGAWDGAISMQGQSLLISLTFNTMDGQTDGAIDIPQQSAFNLPVEVPLLTADSLVFSFETGSGTAYFRSALSTPAPEQIEGVFEQSGVELPFNMSRSIPESVEEYDTHAEEEITIPKESQTITGTLAKPYSPSNNTLMILISGSGSQTRNSTVAGFDLFKEMAGQFAAQGIYTFRYDDRGIGGSDGEPDATLSELSEDLEVIAEYFNEEENGNSFDSIVFLGHSQGGLISMLTAADFTPVSLILLATPMLPGDQIITQQIRRISEEQGIAEDVVEQNLEFQNRVYEAARTGEGWDELEADIEERLRGQLNQLPESQRSTLGNMDRFIESQVSRQLDGAKSRWFKSFIETDPRQLLQNLDLPVLSVFGENDSQVLESANREALEEFGGNVTIITIPDANHLFQVSESGMPGEYGTLDKEFAPGLIDQIVEFLNQSPDRP